MPHEELISALRGQRPSKGMLAVRPDEAMKGLAERSIKRDEDRKKKPPVHGARMAPDGMHYVPDPSRPGKYLMVDNGSETGTSVGS